MRWLAIVLLACACPAQVRVLFLTHSAGFRHPVVKRAKQAVLAHAERRFVEAASGQLEVDCTQDCATITADNLKRYRAVLLYTTGELPISEENRRALLEWVRAGGALCGVHSATDTFYRWPEYGELIGGYFNRHPWHQKVRVLVEDAAHPASAHLAPAFEMTDEIYQFKNFSRDRVHVLLALDPKSVDIGKGARKDGDYALAWSRSYGKGRVFYTSLGHRPSVWNDRRFQRHLVGGVRWAINDEAAFGEAPAASERLFREKDEVAAVVPGKGGFESEKRYQSMRLHLEFKVPADCKKGGNSGVYLQRRYEIQILDSYGRGRKASECGSLYRRRPPDVNAARPAGEWQSYDVWFTAAKFDAEGNKVRKARVTVIWNGIVVHDDVEIAGKTGAGRKEGAAPGPLWLQDHGSAVEFRNVWVLAR